MKNAGKVIIGVVLAIAVAFIVLAATRKPSGTVTDALEREPEELTPSQRITAAAAKVEEGKTVWDYIHEYTQRREAIVSIGEAAPAPTATKSGAQVVKEVVQDIEDDEIAQAISAACPVRQWRVKYFDKNTRQWEIVYVPAVTSTEAIAIVEPTVNGGLFSADKA